jgi:hypothetical protein
MISCRARLMTTEETWLYHYDPETKQESMEWRHKGSPRPKIYGVQKSAGKFLASIFWDQDSILISYLPKGQTIFTEYYSSLLVQLKGILTEKRHSARSSPRWSCSCTTMPRLTGHLQPRRNRPTWASSALITRAILRIWTVGLPLVPWTEKNNCKFPIFRLKRRSLLPRRHGWTDNILNFFEWLAKFRATG